MTLLAELDDPHDPRLAHAATGLLRAFNEAGVLDAADVHVAMRLCALAADDDDEQVALAVALLVRAVRGGSVCIDLATVADDLAADALDLPLPETDAWHDVIATSPLVAGGPAVQAPVLRLLDHDDGRRRLRLLYLDRYWREEEQVHADLVGRPSGAAAPDEAWLAGALDRVFPAEGYDEQRAAARVALTHATTVLTGGPGTGKTTTVAALLALCAEQAELAGDPALRIALAAPTGKAAARLQQAVEDEVAKLPAPDRDRLAGVRAVTLHRLLGSRPDTSSRFRHHRDNRLPHDVVVVDETSMVSLTMMARLLEAVRSGSRLILVGDPFQLASVEAGAVLADLVETVEDTTRVGVAALVTSHRFGASIGALAEAVRSGDADRAIELLEAGGDHVELVHVDDPAPRVRELVVPHALGVLEAAEAGDADRALELLDRRRLLCAHREGSFGVRHWNAQVERWLGEATGEPIYATWYAGRPLLVTANDYGLGIYNGDTGVAVRPPVTRSGGSGRALRAAVAGSSGRLDLATSRLGQVETMHALTIHKSQGSQADEVVVILPPPESRLLTRELLYTAITRARQRVVVVGSPDDVRAAIDRRALRATGLRQRLAGASAP
ncbi:exodeoxyribonuclease V subunit alpha [Nocardioides halotolerans]|uniref:exodeoxyribonuclease V subunit alpha n=1 Tax=Nocardioides halotolerans TaxID=433660 RepID=UPI00040A4E27|nr:exodeoxyribonuclease V subunit alpha [Nocardioides halotolerans]